MVLWSGRVLKVRKKNTDIKPALHEGTQRDLNVPQLMEVYCTPNTVRRCNIIEPWLQ